MNMLTEKWEMQNIKRSTSHTCLPAGREEKHGRTRKETGRHRERIRTSDGRVEYHFVRRIAMLVGDAEEYESAQIIR
jgi:hypothetical protein